ncbi:mitochondrial potassium channel-like [Patiria miniata]|uniref:Coiled-coil domain-containing protein 51 n=1 Tax=Patiria miniata TaxID=46514 RepID=A0A914AXQ4_PATMI|nr:mitochondrial potassium channel-like [Patiria miniata]
MARQFDFQKLTVIRALRTMSTSSSGAAENSVSGPGRPAAGGGAAPPGEAAPTGLLSRLRSDGIVVSLLQSYEELVGIGEVKRAQRRVTQVEQQFMEVRETLKKSAHKLHNHNAELRAIRAKLDQTARDDTKFLEYATEEHLAIQKERKMEEEHYLLEDTERNTFAYLSAAVRESHEKQRSQDQRTKYVGISCSIVGTIIIGLLGSMAINQKRMSNQVTVALERFSEQQQQGFDSQERSLTRILKHQEGLLLKEIEGVRRFAAVGAGDMTTLEEPVNNAEPKLGQKISTLSAVVYGGFIAVLMLPFLYSIFK